MEDVVIAGIAGKLPESENLQEFWENLLNGVDMVTEDDRRWKPGECLQSLLLEPKVLRILEELSYERKEFILCKTLRELLNYLLMYHLEIQEHNTFMKVSCNLLYNVMSHAVVT